LYEPTRILSVKEDAVVCLAKQRSDGVNVVIKLTDDRLELEILPKLGKHERHIVEFLGTFKTTLTSFRYAVVMPQYDATAKSWRGNELERCCFIYQLFQVSVFLCYY
jgi:hypothetical protein